MVEATAEASECEYSIVASGDCEFVQFGQLSCGFVGGAGGVQRLDQLRVQLNRDA